jgi:IS605 OrfB family transposase
LKAFLKMAENKDQLSSIRTFGARVFVRAEQHEALLAMAETFASARGALFKLYKIEQQPLGKCKRQITSRYNLSSRQFNGVRFDVDQVCNTWSGTLDYRITFLKDKAKSQGDRLKGLEKKKSGLDKDIQKLLTYRTTLSAFRLKEKTTPSIKPAKPPRCPVVFGNSAFSGTPTIGQISLLVQDLRARLKQLTGRIHRLTDKTSQTHHQILQLETEKAGPPRICLGGREALRRANQHFSQTGDRSELDAWKQHRQSQLTFVGSKDETAGCLGAQYNPDLHTLQISLQPEKQTSLPDSGQDSSRDEDLDENLAGTAIDSISSTSPARLPKITLDLGSKAFARNKGQEILKDAITPRHVPKLDSKTGLPVPGKTSLLRGSALTWKLWAEPAENKIDPVTDEILYAWAVRVSLSVPAKTQITSPLCGAIGIDVNADHLACSRIDRFGNLVETKTFPFPHAKDGRTKGQSRAMIESACVELCKWAESHNMPIIIENLDFSKKKAGLKAVHARFAHLLSSFAYSKFKEALLSRASKTGLEVHAVNPAFTSKIASIKYQPVFPQHSIHTLASFVIARRGMGELISGKTGSQNPLYTERFKKPISVPDPARSLERGCWLRWKRATVGERKFISSVENLCSPKSSSQGAVSSPPLLA